MLCWAAVNSVQSAPHTSRLNHAPPLRRSHTAIFATSIPRQRSSQPSDEDEPHDSVGGGLGHAVLTAFRSQSTTHDDGTRTGKTKLLNKKSLEKDKGDEEMGKEPSGSDILLALQKASAQRKNKKKPGTGTSKSKMKGKTDAEEEEEKDKDYSNARPIKIKTEWSERLDELEKQLQELSEI